MTISSNYTPLRDGFLRSLPLDPKKMFPEKKFSTTEDLPSGSLQDLKLSLGDVLANFSKIHKDVD